MDTTPEAMATSEGVVTASIELRTVSDSGVPALESEVTQAQVGSDSVDNGDLPPTSEAAELVTSQSRKSFDSERPNPDTPASTSYLNDEYGTMTLSAVNASDVAKELTTLTKASSNSTFRRPSYQVDSLGVDGTSPSGVAKTQEYNTISGATAKSMKSELKFALNHPTHSSASPVNGSQSGARDYDEASTKTIKRRSFSMFENVEAADPSCSTADRGPHKQKRPSINPLSRIVNQTWGRAELNHPEGRKVKADLDLLLMMADGAELSGRPGNAEKLRRIVDGVGSSVKKLVAKDTEQQALGVNLPGKELERRAALQHRGRASIFFTPSKPSVLLPTSLEAAEEGDEEAGTSGVELEVAEEGEQQQPSRPQLVGWQKFLYDNILVLILSIFMLVMLPVAKDYLPHEARLAHTTSIGPGVSYHHLLKEEPLNVVELHLVMPGLAHALGHGHGAAFEDSAHHYRHLLAENSTHSETEGESESSIQAGLNVTKEVEIEVEVLVEQHVTAPSTRGVTDAVHGMTWKVLKRRTISLETRAADSFLTFRHLKDESEYDSHGGPMRITVGLPPGPSVVEGLFAVEVHAHQLGWIGEAQVPLAFILLGMVLGCIATEAIHRTLAAFAGAFFVLMLLLAVDRVPSLGLVVEWIDEGALLLLFAMMILIGKLSTTGFFEVACIQVVRLAGASKFKLLTILCFLTAVLSAFLDNVTTVLLLVPVTISLCDVLKIDPVPFLIGETVFSNIGGCATMIGDPPNIIIGNGVEEYDIGFMDFIINLAPGVLLCSLPCLLLLRYLYYDQVVGELEHYQAALAMRDQFAIKDRTLLHRLGIVMGAVIIGFLTHPVHHVNPAWISLIGAVLTMLATSPHHIHNDLAAVEWDTLLFFAGLFVMVEGMAELGMIRSIGDALSDLIAAVDAESRQRVAIVLIMFASAIISGFLDNIPYTATLVPVIKQLARNKELGLGIEPLAWSLAFGACLGGNGSLVGASANIVMAGMAEKLLPPEGEKITFASFTKVGFPMMLLSVVICCVYLVLVFEL